MTEQETQNIVEETPVVEAPASPVAEVAEKPQVTAPARAPQRGGQRPGPGGRGGAGGGRRPRRDEGDRPKPEFDQKTVSIRRVTRVVSGGRRFAFSVAVAIGDKKGKVGFGIGKAGETALAMQKAYNVAKKNMIQVKLGDTKSIAHDVSAKYNSARVSLMPNRGRGVVVGSSMRMIIELAGIHDITGRVISGSKNKINIAKATVDALRAFAV